MRAESFGNLRKAKSERTLSPPDHRSTSCQGPTRESRLVSLPKTAAQNFHEASIEIFAEGQHPLLGGDVKASIASDKPNRGAMIWIPGGSFLMGSNDFYREERPVRRESVRGFWIDSHPVTNAGFRQFVSATGYATACERPPNPAFYPDADPSL